MLNFSVVNPLISFWQTKRLHVGVNMTKLHPLPLPRMVNNAHLVTQKNHILNSSLIGPMSFLAGIMTSYGCGNDQTTSFDICM